MWVCNDCVVSPLPVTFPLMRRSQGGVAEGEIILEDNEFKGTQCQLTSFVHSPSSLDEYINE